VGTGVLWAHPAYCSLGSPCLLFSGDWGSVPSVKWLWCTDDD